LDAVEGSESFLKDFAEVLVLFLHGTQLVLYSSVPHGFISMDVTLKSAKTSRLVLSEDVVMLAAASGCC